MSRKIYCLIKAYDSEEYAKAFINTGEMYCKTLEEFNEINDDNERGDRFEGGLSLVFKRKTSRCHSRLEMGMTRVLNTVDIGSQDLAGPTSFSSLQFLPASICFACMR